MPSLLFRGVKVNRFDDRATEAGLFCRVYLRADYSEPVREEMEWDPLPGCASMMKIDAEIAAVEKFVLEPVEPELGQFRIDGSAIDVADFRVHRVKIENSEATTTEIRFILRTKDEAAEAAFALWMRHIRAGVGTLKINFPVQQELFDQPASAANGDSGSSAAVVDSPPSEKPEPGGKCQYCLDDQPIDPENPRLHLVKEGRRTRKMNCARFVPTPISGRGTVVEIQ